MQTLAGVLVFLVALAHMYFMVLEMCLWTKPRTLKIFGMSAQQAESSRVLAANQGLYNGFLAVGLLFGFIYPIASASLHIQSFFLLCIVVAGVYAGLTVSRRILFVQALPAFVALCALWLS